MKRLDFRVVMVGLMMSTAACDKSMVMRASDDASIQTLSCKGSTAEVDPSDLKIEGASVAQAGRAANFKLNYDLSCSSSQKVSWQTSDGQILASNNKGMVSSFPASGRYVVSAVVQSSGAQFAAKSGASIVQKTTVVGSSPMIAGPQVGIVGHSYSYELALPEGFTLTSTSWNFADGSAAVMGASAQAHTWGSPGSYNIKASIVDGNGAASVVSYSVTIIDIFDGTECVVDTAINAPTQGYVGQAIAASVYLPSCIAGAVSSVAWSYGEATAAGAGTSVQHTFSAVGDYVLTVNVYAPYVASGTPFFTLTQPIHISEMPATPTPTPTPAPGASPTPVPSANSCESAGATRESTTPSVTRQAACGMDGTKSQTFQTRVIELCKVVDGSLSWVESSRAEVMISEGACQGQSCTLPDGSKLANGQSRVLYSSSTPAGSCSSVSQSRTCNNGILSGASSYSQLSCRSGCGDFGADGTVKTGVNVGQSQVPLVCAFGEQGYFDVFNQLADQKCSDGSVVSSNTRQGTLKTAGACPIYAWAPTDSWTACSANCGGKQSLMYQCKDDKGVAAPAERCASMAMPVTERVCDGNPDAAKRVEISTSQESAGSTQKCPANQIGVIVSERTVTETKTYACIDHSVQLASDVKVEGAWANESYCRDYVGYRCSQDSLSITDAKARYNWMLACQDKVPAIKEFLTEFKDVKVSGGYSIDSQTRPLYPTFMNNATKPEKVWIAPIRANGSCVVPQGAYVAAVCLSSCATPEQEILAQAKANLKLKYMPFIEALTQKSSAVATLASGSAMDSKKVVQTKVDQWVTEMMDTDHDIIEFRMQSGRVLKLTPNHPVLAESGVMKPAGDFRIGDKLVMLGGELDPIVSLNQVKYFGKVYNLFVQSSELQRNVVVTNGYLNGTAYFQNEGAVNMNRAIFRDKLVKGAIK